MAFPFRNQPLTSLYVLYTAVSIIFLRLPFWVVISAFPSLRPRRTWSMGRTIAVYGLQAVVDAMYKIGFAPSKDPEAFKSQPGFACVNGIDLDMVVGHVASAAKLNNMSPATICGYWSGKTGAESTDGHPASAQERVLYVLHGGGHVSGAANPKSDNAPVTAPILDNAGGLINRAFAVEYRLCSAAPFQAANPFPANLLDVLAGYRYLVNDIGFEPKNIVVAGVSSGGHLAFDLVLYLTQSNFPSLPAPGGLLLMSPTVDWARTHDKHPSCSMIRNRSADIVDPILSNGYTARALLGALPETELATNPYLSPASLALTNPRGLFAGFPPTCITAGDAEQTLDPMKTLRDRLTADNNKEHIRYLEYIDANHSFLTLPLFEPQRSQAYSDIGRWIADVFEEGS
ncbi:alpha/beta-hydrolase [Mycena polygramma]|nr:alpha/beta-hydrolase [Mycena polygramma]